MAHVRTANTRPDVLQTPLALEDSATCFRADVIEPYLQQSGVDVTSEHGVDHLAMAMWLVASTRGLALMLEYANNLLPWSVVSRPLEDDAPTVDLVVG